jgi:hypothetical protein
MDRGGKGETPKAAMGSHLDVSAYTQELCQYVAARSWSAWLALVVVPLGGFRAQRLRQGCQDWTAGQEGTRGFSFWQALSAMAENKSKKKSANS